jgi:hypothetical protein
MASIPGMPWRRKVLGWKLVLFDNDMMKITGCFNCRMVLILAYSFVHSSADVFIY